MSTNQSPFVESGRASLEMARQARHRESEVPSMRADCRVGHLPRYQNHEIPTTCQRTYFVRAFDLNRASGVANGRTATVPRRTSTR
jgi:hypothetical protein